jgi:hypothetical protein
MHLSSIQHPVQRGDTEPGGSESNEIYRPQGDGSTLEEAASAQDKQSGETSSHPELNSMSDASEIPLLFGFLAEAGKNSGSSIDMISSRH